MSPRASVPECPRARRSPRSTSRTRTQPASRAGATRRRCTCAISPCSSGSSRTRSTCISSVTGATPRCRSCRCPRGRSRATWAHPRTPARFACLWRQEVNDGARSAAESAGRATTRCATRSSSPSRRRSCARSAGSRPPVRADDARLRGRQSTSPRSRTSSGSCASDARRQELAGRRCPPTDVAAFEAIAGDLLAALGYERSAGGDAGRAGGSCARLVPTPGSRVERHRLARRSARRSGAAATRGSQPEWLRLDISAADRDEPAVQREEVRPLGGDPGRVLAERKPPRRSCRPSRALRRSVFSRVEKNTYGRRSRPARRGSFLRPRCSRARRPWSPGTRAGARRIRRRRPVPSTTAGVV